MAWKIHENPLRDSLKFQQQGFALFSTAQMANLSQKFQPND